LGLVKGLREASGLGRPLALSLGEGGMELSFDLGAENADIMDRAFGEAG